MRSYKYLLSSILVGKLKDKKAAKLIIKRAKKHPEMYSKEEVYYAKEFRKRLKREKKMKELEESD